MRRPALEAVLDDVGLSLTVADTHLDRFVRSVVTALRPWLPDLADVALQASHGSSPDAARSELVAGLISEGLAQSLEHDLVVVLDDLHVLPTGSDSARFVEALCRQAPTTVHVVVAARRLPLRVQRLRGRGEVVELTSMELAFTPAEVDVLTEQRVGSWQAELVAAG
jgi:ATP/maltotriose-dependent transcriptional regulator MalT